VTPEAFSSIPGRSTQPRFSYMRRARWFTGERHDYDESAVVVMADSEGHEFCLVQYY